jgi:hypothetical protein
MSPNVYAGKRKNSWPSQGEWARQFAKRLKADKPASVAYHLLTSDECVPGNLMSFLYSYTFSPVAVFKEHSRARDTVSSGLRAVACKLESSAMAMQQVLDTEWWGEPTFASFLRERCRFDFQAGSRARIFISGNSSPEFALHLPSILSCYSRALEVVRKGVQENTNTRVVGKVIYLAEFATYIEMLTQKPIPWSAIAEVVNIARPENWKEKQADPSLLRKNFRNFTRRNKELDCQIRADMSAYLDACARLPRLERSTFATWTLKQ